MAREAFLLKRSKCSLVKLHLLPSSFQRLNYTPILCIRLFLTEASKTCSRQVKLSPTLRKEISHWRFLDSWQGCLRWRNESHLQVQLFSDASDFGWGGYLFSPGQPEVVIRGYWDEADRGRPIIVKEIQALRLTLENLLHRSENTRVDVFVDNKALVSSWESQVSRSF